MGWEDSHLHQFIVDGRAYGRPHPDWEEPVPVLNERKATLLLLARPGDSFTYEYDFGDGWEHEVVAEKALPAEEGVIYSRCLEGEGACPPEDVGGTQGYADFLRAISDQHHPEHQAMLAWVGGWFDPAEFGRHYVNWCLAGLSRRPAQEQPAEAGDDGPPSPLAGHFIDK